MDSVLVLMAQPGSDAISSRVVEALRDYGSVAPQWLAAGDALEVKTFARLPEFLIEVKSLPIDTAVVSSHNRRKRLLVADMDSTMIREECVDELGIAAGVGERVAAITARAMRGELDFEGALIERVALLKGLPASIIETLIRDRITFMPGGKTLLATMKAHGAYTALISGGFTAFTRHVAAALGFDEHRANILEISGDILNGRVTKPVLGKEAKHAGLIELAKRHGLGLDETMAVGDGANDLPMLLAAGLGVALHAKPTVQAQVAVRVNHADLTALLFLQGYRREQFVVA